MLVETKEENCQYGRDEQRNDHVADDQRAEGPVISTELARSDQRPSRVVDEAFHEGRAHPIEHESEGN